MLDALVLVTLKVFIILLMALFIAGLVYVGSTLVMDFLSERLTRNGNGNG
jgi:hypothetical protein